jgi:hypothetical protein
MDVLSDIREVVRYNGIHIHSVIFYNIFMYFNLEFSSEEIKVKVAMRET